MIKMELNIKKLDLNITNRCNYRCVHCCFDSGIKNMEELSYDEIERVLTDARELGVKRIDVTGGETLVRKDLEQILKKGKELGFRIELLTNGSLLTKEKLLRFKEIGLDALGISLDGSIHEIYKNIRGQTPKTFKRVVENIKLCKDLGFYTKVNTVVFESNINDIPSITQLCIDLEIDEHGIYYFTPIGRGKSNSNLVVHPLDWLELAKRELSQYKDKMKLSIELAYANSNNCNGAKTKCFIQDPHHLQILPNGNVYPCAIMAAYEKPLGNLRERSLKEIWHDGAGWDRYRKNIEHVMARHNGCVDYSACFPDSQIYQFICPCRKFSIDEVFRNEREVCSL